MLIGLCPIPYRSASCDAGCAFVPNTFITKDSLGFFHKGRALGYLRLSGLRFFGAALFLFLCKEQFYVSLHEEAPAFLLSLYDSPGRALLRQQLGIFRIQFFHLGELFQVSFIECRFRCLVQCDLCTMTFQKVLAVSGLSVGIIDWSRLGVVDDV